MKCAIQINLTWLDLTWLTISALQCPNTAWNKTPDELRRSRPGCRAEANGQQGGGSLHLFIHWSSWEMWKVKWMSLEPWLGYCENMRKVDVSLLHYTWFKWMAPYQATAELDDELIIWIRCGGKHAGQWVMRTGTEKHCAMLTDIDCRERYL